MSMALNNVVTSSVLMKHGPIEAINRYGVRVSIRVSSVLMKHGPIEAACARRRRLYSRMSSVLMKHGPIEASLRIPELRVMRGVFRADEARPH